MRSDNIKKTILLIFSFENFVTKFIIQEIIIELNITYNNEQINIYYDVNNNISSICTTRYN